MGAKGQKGEAGMKGDQGMTGKNVCYILFQIFRKSVDYIDYA